MEKEHRKESKKKLWDKARLSFEASSFRLTEPRKALLELILSAEGPFSVPKLLKSAKPGDKIQFDPVTVYRNLPVFEELKIIEKCDFSGDTTFYEVILDHKHDHHHHHVVCKECRRVDPLDFCIVQAQVTVLEKLGYTGLSHKLEFLGVCPQCSG